MGQGLLIARITKIVAKLGVHFRPMRGGPRGNFFRYGLQSLQMSGRVAITPPMVSDDGHPAAKEFNQF